MAKTRQQKEQEVQNLKNQLEGVKGAVFADYTGLNVSEIQDLRLKLKESNSQLTVIRRTLFKLALRAAGLDIDVNSMPGAVSIASSSQDEVMPAKIMAEFAKGHEALKIQGGILDYKFIDIAKVGELAKLPTKFELLARVTGSIQAPVSGFVNVLAGNLRGLVRALDVIRESKA